MTQAPLSDPAYLRAVQYADEGNLDARARLHRRYGLRVGAAFAAGGGAMRIGKDAGLFTCRRPRLSKA